MRLIKAFSPQEKTSAVVGVKAEIGTPDPATPNTGRIEFFVDW